MPTLKRTVTTAADHRTVFAYLVDFENAVEWDAGTVSCRRTHGSGEVGSVYHNTSTFMGRSVELDYTLEQAGEPTIRLVGRNKTVQSVDTIVVTPTGDGTSVEYTAEFTFSGPAKLLGPLMRPFLKKLGDDAETTLKQALDRLS